jgi:FtsH-binding integral membrane protein
MLRRRISQRLLYARLQFIFHDTLPLSVVFLCHVNSCDAIFVIVSRYAATEKQIHKMCTLFFMWGNTGARVARVCLIDVTLTELRLYWSIIAREILWSTENDYRTTALTVHRI